MTCDTLVPDSLSRFKPGGFSTRHFFSTEKKWMKAANIAETANVSKTWW